MAKVNHIILYRLVLYFPFDVIFYVYSHSNNNNTIWTIKYFIYNEKRKTTKHVKRTRTENVQQFISHSKRCFYAPFLSFVFSFLTSSIFNVNTWFDTYVTFILSCCLLLLDRLGQRKTTRIFHNIIILNVNIYHVYLFNPL